MSEYEAIFLAHLKKANDLQQEEKRIRSSIEKVNEMLKASFFLMTEEEQGKLLTVYTAALEQVTKEQIGLTDAIRNVLESNPMEWFHAVKVRESLNQSGFDFSTYTTNPLTSIHTVLKRFKRAEVKTRKGKMGLQEYRWASQVSRQQRLSAALQKMGKLSDLA